MENLTPVQLTRRDRLWIDLTLDAILSLLVAGVALVLWNLESPHAFARDWFMRRGIWVPVLSGGTLAIFGMTGLYMVNAPADSREPFFRVVRGLTVFLALYYTIYFFAPRGSLPRLVVLFYVILSFPVFIASRRLLAWLADRPLLQRNMILLGTPGDASRLQSFLGENTMTGIRLLGLYPVASRDDGQPPEPDGSLRTLDPGRTLIRYARRLNVNGVVLFSDPEGFPDEMLNQLVECHRKGISITSGLDLIEELSGRFPLAYARERPERMFPSRKHEGVFYGVLKRVIDLAGALVGLLLFLPLLPFLAAGIKLTSSGPVFFRQERTGRYGRPFELIKLRTMVANAEAESGAQWAKENDPRVTSFGRFLRLTHLDEFPQFWNVLKGDMSLVGPRPERPEIEEELTGPNPFFKLRHSVRPGITGWATIRNTYVDSMEKAERRLEYDLYYIEHQSFWMDLHILFETAWELITFGGR